MFFPVFPTLGVQNLFFPRTVFTGKYRGKNRVPSKTLQPWQWLFVQQFVEVNIKGNAKAPHYWALREIHRWPLVSRDRGSALKCFRSRKLPYLSRVLKQFHKNVCNVFEHEDVIKWKHFPRYWPFVRGIHRSLVNSPHKDHWRGALMFSLICARTNGWANHRDADDLRRHRTHYDFTVMNVSTAWSHHI